MAGSSITLLDLPLELFTAECQQLDLRDLVRVAAACTRFRHSDGELETAELPTKSPVVTALRELAFPGGEMVPSTRPIGCSESWVAYLARCVRQRRFREAPPIAAGNGQSLFLDGAGRLLACGTGEATGHGDADAIYSDPAPMAALAGLRVRSVTAGSEHSLALSWAGRVFSWGTNRYGQLGHGDKLARPAPALVEGLEGVGGIAAAHNRSLAVTQSGIVFFWGCAVEPEAPDVLRPILVEGFKGVRVRRVYAGQSVILAVGEDGELFSWGCSEDRLMGHGDTQDQPLPKRFEALRGVRVSTVAVDFRHALALAEDGLVYAWAMSNYGALLGKPNFYRELLPVPVEVLRGVRLGSIAVTRFRSYAVADTGEVRAWGCDGNSYTPIGHGEQMKCQLPKPIASLQGIKVDAVAVCDHHTLALADYGSVYAWGSRDAAE
jgi:alpha-tubulin suppressor-like RCC1 family protein